MIVLYAWQEGDKWLLSRFKRVQGKPRNEYQSQAQVVEAATERRSTDNPVKIEWLPQ